MPLARRLDLIAAVPAALLVAAASVLGAYLMGPLVPLAVVGVLGAVALALARPMAALYVALALVPLELLSLQLGEAQLSPAEAMFALTGLAWAARRLTEGELPVVASPLTMPLGLLILSIVPGLAFAEDTFLVAKTLLMWTSFFFVYQAVITEADADTVRRLLMVLAGAGAVVGLVAAIESGGGVEAPTLTGVGQDALNRAEGSFDDPNILATFEALALPAALALGLHMRGRFALPGLVAFALILAGLTLSLSRGGLLAVAAALVVMIWWAPFRRIVLAAAAVVLFFALAGANPFGDVRQIETVTQRISSVSYSAQGVNPRFTIWETAPEMIADHPLFGVGANNFPEVAARYGLLGADGSAYAHAHNIPLTIGAELGLVGLAALLWAAVALVRTLGRAYSRAGPETRGMVVAVMAALTALALQGLVDYTLSANVIAAVAVTLVGCAVALSRDAPRYGGTART